LLAAAANTQSNVKAENTSLKRELSRLQKQILNLEAQFNELEKNQSEVFTRIFSIIKKGTKTKISPFFYF